jgi:hypothetical protein
MRPRSYQTDKNVTIPQSSVTLQVVCLGDSEDCHDVEVTRVTWMLRRFAYVETASVCSVVGVLKYQRQGLDSTNGRWQCKREDGRVEDRLVDIRITKQRFQTSRS